MLYHNKRGAEGSLLLEGRVLHLCEWIHYMLNLICNPNCLQASAQCAHDSFQTLPVVRDKTSKLVIDNGSYLFLSKDIPHIVLNFITTKSEDKLVVTKANFPVRQWVFRRKAEVHWTIKCLSNRIISQRCSMVNITVFFHFLLPSHINCA